MHTINCLFLLLTMSSSTTSQTTTTTIGFFSPTKKYYFAQSFSETHINFLYNITSNEDINLSVFESNVIPTFQSKKFSNLPDKIGDNNLAHPIKLQSQNVDKLFVEILYKLKNRNIFNAKSPIYKQLDCLITYEKVNKDTVTDFIIHITNRINSLPSVPNNKLNDKSNQIYKTCLNDLLDLETTLRIFLNYLNNQQNEIFNLFKNKTTRSIREEIKNSTCLQKTDNSKHVIKILSCNPYKIGILCQINVITMLNITEKYALLGTPLFDYSIDTNNAYSSEAINLQNSINIAKITCENKLMNIYYNCSSIPYNEACQKAVNSKNVKNVLSKCTFHPSPPKQYFQTYYFTLIVNPHNKFYKNKTFIADDEFPIGISSHVNITITDNLSNKKFMIKKVNVENITIHKTYFSPSEKDEIKQYFLNDFGTLDGDLFTMENMIYAIYGTIMLILIAFVLLVLYNIKTKPNLVTNINIDRRKENKHLTPIRKK